MFLLVSATETEMESLRLSLGRFPQVVPLVTGVGPVQSAVTLTKYLATCDIAFEGAINFGVGGAFIDTGLGLLDICLAHKEIFGDLGVCRENEIGFFESGNMAVQTEFDLKNSLLDQAETILQKQQIHYRCGNFVTVSCVSGTAKRGNYLRDKHQALCENMEGAALASVCQSFEIPYLELRCISNFVEDRDLTRWKLPQACSKSADTVGMLLRVLLERQSHG